MIEFEHPEVWGWEHAIRGMRNPLNSWDKSDSSFNYDVEATTAGDEEPQYIHIDAMIGYNDLDLMRRLIRAGSSHRKFLRQIFVSVDITAPRYWWAEADTYKVGTTANSCSTMHKITAKEFTLDDFSHEHLIPRALDTLQATVDALNAYRSDYIQTKDKIAWWQLIQLLPQSYNQRRTVTLTYENLLNMVGQRQGHKLDEWHDFCDWVFTLPYAEELLKEGLK